MVLRITSISVRLWLVELSLCSYAFEHAWTFSLKVKIYKLFISLLRSWLIWNNAFWNPVFTFPLNYWKPFLALKWWSTYNVIVSLAQSLFFHWFCINSLEVVILCNISVQIQASWLVRLCDFYLRPVKVHLLACLYLAHLWFFTTRKKNHTSLTSHERLIHISLLENNEIIM